MEVRADRVQRDYLNKAKHIDRIYNNVSEGEEGPVERHMKTFNNGIIDGFVVGPFSECSRQVHALRDLIVERKVNYLYQHLDIDSAQIKSNQKFKKSMSKSWGLFFASGWARVLMERIQIFYTNPTEDDSDSTPLSPEESEMACNQPYI